MWKSSFAVPDGTSVSAKRGEPEHQVNEAEKANALDAFNETASAVAPNSEQ
jgi:hypothetical protein